jgi:hypothetical protein
MRQISLDHRAAPHCRRRPGALGAIGKTGQPALERQQPRMQQAQVIAIIGQRCTVGANGQAAVKQRMAPGSGLTQRGQDVDMGQGGRGRNRSAPVESCR